MTKKSKVELCLESELPIARRSEIVTQETGDELLVYDLKTNKAHQLNQTAKLIWKHCDGKTKITDFVTKSNVAEELVYIALDNLQKSNLLEDEIDVPIPKDQMERRKFLIKAGAISAVALPVISSLVAPQATVAQSCVGNGQFTNSQPPIPFVSVQDCFNYCAIPCCSGMANQPNSVIGIGNNICTCQNIQCS